MSNTKKAATARTEASDEKINVEYDGATYTVHAQAFNDLLLLDLLASFEEDGKAYLLPRIIQRILGPEQWDSFIAKYTVDGRVDAKHAGELFEALGESMGKSSAS